MRGVSSILSLFRNEFIINIIPKCEGGIEISVPNITDWQLEAYRVMTNDDLEGWINYPIILLTTKYLILY